MTPTLRYALAPLVLLMAGCASTGPVPPTTVAAVGAISDEIPYPKGYLEAAAMPDSLALLPPPPAEGSAAKAADQEAYQQSLAASPERQAIAASDADLTWPHVVSGFEQVLGISLSDGSKPHTEMLLRRAMADAGLSTYRAKNNYQRVRPFVENNVGTCLPKDEEALRSDGSYPSGHTAIGWMLALVLTELAPDREDALLKRGYEFGQSRVVCRAHWMSDTVGGRVTASATFARLQANPTFRAQMDLAREEMAKAR
ncbi:phosphatase PAP2 family protein [Altererythrobacter salegens]|uniref:Acid phosphatase n=1 Tax=Croceibacterium salegens TaxID=1737568 RepID=A0A6I4T161_9SPHN|nr:phosphatase PAP2 family protein [Croceibacterium salegens]MXO61208.1 phosphatase PAP2 family protein [Croceibacterium salegens]